jgi:membrane protein DedA with SNARE-associated domain
MSDFQAFAARYAAYGYPLLFFGVLLESAGVPLPGETAVLVAGFLASPTGGGHFNVVWVIILTTLAAMLGDNIGYELGRRLARPRLQNGRRFLFMTPEVMRHVEYYFDRYGTWTIFFGRFIAALRVAAALAAGVAGMPWRRFFLANAAGALAWATAVSLLGYFFGNSIPLIHRWLGRGSAVVLGCVVLIVGLPYLLRRLRRMPEWQQLLRAELVQGLLVAVLEVACIAVLVLLAAGRHETHVDEEVAAWIADHRTPVLDHAAWLGSVLGTFLVMVLLAIVVYAMTLRSRPWREPAVLLGVLAGSEAVGWLLIGLLRLHRVEPVSAEVWPFGFAGIVPLRALAVLGISAYLLSKRFPDQSRAIHVGCAVLIAWTGFGVLWEGSQSVSEVLLEYTAGSLVLFAGIRWLERSSAVGHGDNPESA